MTSGDLQIVLDWIVVGATIFGCATVICATVLLYPVVERWVTRLR